MKNRMANGLAVEYNKRNIPGICLMTIQLTPAQEQIVQNKLQTELYASAEEVIEIALQLVNEDESGEPDLKKSSPITKEIGGKNPGKYKSYREAWSRIKQAQENQFFLEAITIQESIISDRLISFLAGSNVKNILTKDKRGRWPSFGNLIQRWESEFSEELKSGETQNLANLINAVDQWRNDRNEAIHAIVKSDPGEPTQDIDLFLRTAKKVAEQGTYLAKEVCKWHQAQKKSKVPKLNHHKSLPYHQQSQPSER
jgi:Arc/MetJ-type ribon-helix-helix transcriptional regulator